MICPTFAQNVEMPLTATDSVPSEPIIFTTSSASDYIIDLLKNEDLWRSSGEKMKLSLERLVDHYNEPFDSVQSRLFRFNFDSIDLKKVDIIRNDTIPLRWLNDSTFIVNNVFLEKEPFIVKKTVIKKVVLTPDFLYDQDFPDMETMVDYMLQDQDTIIKTSIDTAYLDSKEIQMYQIVNKRVVPSILSPGGNKTYRFLPDSGKIVISDISKAIIADKESPFYIVPSEKMPDSLRFAVNTLLSHTAVRDSMLLFINDIKGKRTPF
jgi:hypothetical protein